ncbi:pilus assembly protein Flp/PilA [Sphingomonas jinjuensis]|uniref:Pilus assembly protein Flp/PilA n=2 Tax=Sphingomonas jinjuensis TaxID=535907 RepID=A0A840FC21_9SPHN|nr:pilus assembly protein Flp/PilA [Sphingomonas jinjuensis]
MKKRAFLPAMLRRLARDDRAATAVEYGLILALIVLSMFAALHEMAGTTVGMWNNVSTKVQNAR